jgi:methyltransferase (TIGR00027 family)
MLAGGASRTALGAAAHRAAHQIVDLAKVFDDPLAQRILGAEGNAVLRDRLEHAEVGARMRTLIAVRSRIAEDAVREAVENGVKQYVLLGAGLDTFAYRNPHAAQGLRVFEVDHPATQAWKRAHLAEAGIEPPASLRFVPVDFETGSLRAGLETAGFRFTQPALFAWLGVVPYLERAAVLHTLALIVSGPPLTEVVFDYSEPPPAPGSAAYAAYQAAAQRVAALGEPWRTFFAPDELAGELRRLGFDVVEDLDGGAVSRRDDWGHPCAFRLAHVVRARRTCQGAAA